MRVRREGALGGTVKTETWTIDLLREGRRVEGTLERFDIEWVDERRTEIAALVLRVRLHP